MMKCAMGNMSTKSDGRRIHTHIGFLWKDALVDGVLDGRIPPNFGLLRGFAYMWMMMDLDKEGSTAAIW